MVSDHRLFIGIHRVLATLTMVMTALVEPGFPWLISSVEDIINGDEPASVVVFCRVGKSPIIDPSAHGRSRDIELFGDLGDGQLRTLRHDPNMIPCRRPGS